MKIYSSSDCLIGHTPLLELNRIEAKFQLQAKIFAKLECFNPAGSVKDRVANAMIADAEFATATACGIEKVLNTYKDAVVIIDDFIKIVWCFFLSCLLSVHNLRSRDLHYGKY